MKKSKLDRRHLGYGDFKYAINFRTIELNKFCSIRNWCWSQWGPSAEVEYLIKLNGENPGWSWVSDQWRMRIYFATDKEYQWYLLKWE
jgi:hypothetical protein